VISIVAFLPSQLFTLLRKSWIAGATFPAKRPLQKERPMKKEETKQVPPIVISRKHLKHTKGVNKLK
jgi:hypothetical protein